jgi:hypothetical protein
MPLAKSDKPGEMADNDPFDKKSVSGLKDGGRTVSHDMSARLQSRMYL